MNVKAVAVVLALLCAALAAGLFYRHSKAVNEKSADTKTINTYSNKFVQVSADLEEHKAVILSLERDLSEQTREFQIVSNQLVAVTADLTQTKAAAKAAADAAKAEMLKRDARIAELEGERDDLTKRMTALNTSISNLEVEIAETQRKLEAAEGDREFLLQELKRLQTEKAELERQFNDIALLREQVRRLRDELAINRRLDWIRRGFYGNLLKGGELLQKGFDLPEETPNYNLDVELNRDGSVKVIPPVNAPSTDGSTAEPELAPQNQ